VLRAEFMCCQRYSVIVRAVLAWWGSGTPYHACEGLEKAYPRDLLGFGQEFSGFTWASAGLPIPV
jgi:hypothetical protein